MTDDQIDNLIDRNKHLLWLLMRRNIMRYLMSNTHKRLDGAQKAHHHIEMCNIYIAGVLQCYPDGVHFQRDPDGMAVFRAVHDHTQKLTNNLDTEIGFPLEDTRPPYDSLCLLFFNEFLILADEAILPFL